MHKIEWRPIALGIGVTLTLFITIHELLRFCCSHGEFSAYGIFLMVVAFPFTAFISVFIILFPIAFLPLCVGSFIVGRYSTKDVLLQKLSVGIFYYLISWLLLVDIQIIGYYAGITTSILDAIERTIERISIVDVITNIIERIFAGFIFLGLSLLFYKIGARYRKGGEENV